MSRLATVKHHHTDRFYKHADDFEYKHGRGVRVVERPTVDDTQAGNRGGFVDYTKYNYCSSCNKRYPKTKYRCICGDRLRVKSKHSRMRNKPIVARY